MQPNAQRTLSRKVPGFLLLLLSLTLALTACGNGGATPAVDVAAQPTTPAADPTVAVVPTDPPTTDPGAATVGATAGATGAATAAATGTAAGTDADATGGGTLAQIKERGVLRAGVKYDAPPFGSLNPTTNEVTGFDIDIVRELAERILGDPNKVELVQVTSQNRIPQLQNGQIDLFAATATITPSRLEEINFSDVYYRAGQSLLVRSDSDIQSYEDLSGRRVCTVTGSTPEQTIRRLVPDAEVQLFETYPECLTALQGERVDAITTDNVLLKGLQMQDPENLKMVGELFTFEPYGLGIAKGNEDLTEAVNEALQQMREDGTYGEIYQRWLDEPLPEDVDEWFLMEAEEAAQQFEQQSQQGVAPAPAGGETPEVTPTAEAEDTGGAAEATVEPTVEESDY